jgi:hypothetical protein
MKRRTRSGASTKAAQRGNVIWLTRALVAQVMSYGLSECKRQAAPLACMPRASAKRGIICFAPALVSMRFDVLAEADMVMLVGTGLSGLLAHGKGKTWGGAKAACRRFIRIDIAPTEADGNMPIAAPLLGDMRSRAGLARRHRQPLGQAAGRLDRRARRALGREPVDNAPVAGPRTPIA